jgi:hypothetical protein
MFSGAGSSAGGSPSGHGHGGGKGSDTDASAAHSALCRAVRLLIRGDAPVWARMVVWSELGAGRQLLHLLGPNAGMLHRHPSFAFGLPLRRNEASALADVVRHVTAPHYLGVGGVGGGGGSGGGGADDAGAERAAVALRVALRQLGRSCFGLPNAASAERFAREGRLGWGQQELLCRVATSCEPRALWALLREPAEEWGAAAGGAERPAWPRMLEPAERWGALRGAAEQSGADMGAAERAALRRALVQVAALGDGGFALDA